MRAFNSACIVNRNSVPGVVDVVVAIAIQRACCIAVASPAMVRDLTFFLLSPIFSAFLIDAEKMKGVLRYAHSISAPS